MQSTYKYTYKSKFLNFGRYAYFFPSVKIFFQIGVEIKQAKSLNSGRVINYHYQDEIPKWTKPSFEYGKLNDNFILHLLPDDEHLVVKQI